MTHFNREYRATLFAMVFSDKKNLLELYNGVNGTQYDDPDEIEINTLSDENGVSSGIFMKQKNDVSFVFCSRLNLYEHQSTICRNMPVRDLIYFADLLQEMFDKRIFYRQKIVRIPTPVFIVFYNGTQDMPDWEEYRLSDQFEIATESPNLELKVRVFNINAGKNRELLEKCRILNEYSECTAHIYEALKDLTALPEKKKAMSEVIDRCIADGILSDFLQKNKEAIMMSRFWEYDEEAHRQAVYDDGYDDGYDTGRAEEHKLTIAERERAKKAESRANEAESRADEAENRADKAESRTDKAESRAGMLEQELEKQRKKLQMLEKKLREADGAND